ncbi:alpha/beta hydrolase [Streptomyces sp. NBC_00237]|uniref:alpha/beta fold hydrolase n=1 Tax=Streptomyces sp. NBC_00237 TaxID=2975687 RepID=UPI002253D04B|nr:alpha/beta fold hydrolase [Streptomyces sp. NBC_00237]MCX5207198.1 alpha/beta hydrolase [Streptomyces sp. NBC_00237]
MTHFLLVPGGYTGAWIWRDTAHHLRERGHHPHPLTLTGLGDRRHLATPSTTLATHVADVLQALDHLDPADPSEPTVLVGHSYGIHPAVGAALRRPGRIDRLVFLDAAMPAHGLSVIDANPDPTYRTRLRERAESLDGWRLPVPALHDTQLWGSLAEVSEPDLKRMEQLAAPQPLATLEQPLDLPADTPWPPFSAVFCTRGGFASTAAIQALVATGDPRFHRLADPTAGYFDLDTGHYPMLSRPAELADVLIRAAAGEGHRLHTGPQQP